MQFHSVRLCWWTYRFASRCQHYRDNRIRAACRVIWDFLAITADAGQKVADDSAVLLSGPHGTIYLLSVDIVQLAAPRFLPK